MKYETRQFRGSLLTISQNIHEHIRKKNYTQVQTIVSAIGCINDMKYMRYLVNIRLLTANIISKKNNDCQLKINDVYECQNYDNVNVIKKLPQ